MRKIVIKKNSMTNIVAIIICSIMPYTLFINSLFFKNHKIFGIGVINLIYDIVIFSYAVLSMFSKKRSSYNKVYLLLILFFLLYYLRFSFLIKV